VTELLGFDCLVEPAYDCEAGQDHPLTILFGLTNLVTLLSRVAMDHNIWGMEEVAMFRTAPEWHGVSSLMPQKSIPGSQWERIRLEASDVVGCMLTGVVATKGEPHADMLPIYEGWRGALRALCHAEKALGFFVGLLPNVQPDRERMLALAREGFAAAADLAILLIRDHGYGSRPAHRICATFVRLARERGLRAFETTGELLDEAARAVSEREPGLSTEQVRDALDPEAFIRRHDNTGDPAPRESLRMIGERRTALTDSRARHEARKQQVAKARERLAAAVSEILRPDPEGRSAK
jgi:argininosuccinate lyase